MPSHQRVQNNTITEEHQAEVKQLPDTIRTLSPTGKSRRKRKPKGPKRPPRTNYQPLAVPLLDSFSMIGVGVTQGYRLVNKGKIKTFYIGRRRYVEVASLQQLIADGAR
jgi:hypothetical protein